MKVLFIYPTFESLGIEYLSAVLKEGGHEVELLLDPCLFKDKILHHDRLANYFDEFEHIVAQAVAMGPDLLCFSVTTDIVAFAERYSKRLKKELGVPVIWGGVHASVCPQDVLEQEWVDFVVQGEGEHALLDLVNAMQDGCSVNAIPNIWIKQGDDIVGNKTAIYISHRLSSCRFCDDIAVLHEGQLIQRGNHESLLADKHGKYHELWSTQAQYYQN